VATTSESPVIYSTSVLTAQGAKLTTEARAILTAQADGLRGLLGVTHKMPIGVPVIDPYTNATIGRMTYML
jgi:hypothetical protein